MCMLNTLLHQSSMQELDLLNPQLDPRISYTGGPKWYHGPDGLLRESPGNRLLWSQDLNNTAWQKSEASIVANAGLAPDGTLTADRIVPSTTSTNSHRVYQDVIIDTAVPYATSIYAKADGYNFVRVTTYNGTVTVNLVDGSVIATGGPPDAFAVEAAADGYWRITCAMTPAAGASARPQIAVYATADQAAYAGNGVSGILVWGSQFERGAAATTYRPTTSAAVFDWPLEYDPLTLQPLGRSGWEQRTNLAIHSNNLAAWPNNFGITVVSGASTGADGLLSMDKLVEDTSTGVHKAQQNFTVPSAVTNYAFSGTAKAGERTRVRFGAEAGSSVIWNGGAVPQAVFDLTTGAVVSQTASVTYAAARELPGGVWALEVRAQSSGTGGLVGFAYVLLSGGSPTYTGNGASGLYVGTAQMEQSAFAGPYIPTAGSQVTRPSELALVEAITEKLRFPGQSGTAVLEVRYPSSAAKYTFAQIDDGDSTLDDDWLFYTNNNFDHFVCRLYPGGGHTGVHIVTPNTNLRMVEAADAAGAITSVNGDAPTTGANGCSQVGMQRVILGRASSGSGASGAYIRGMAFYPSKFTAAEVQARAG